MEAPLTTTALKGRRKKQNQASIKELTSRARSEGLADTRKPTGGTMIGVGTICGRPSLRTGLADFPHPALQLVVNFQEDRHAAACACFKEYKPTAEK